jgi:uncharacterized protein (TIGR02996 family)
MHTEAGPLERIPVASPRLRFVVLLGVFVLILLTYANHFGNSFHFDDTHTIQDNPWIRDVRNIPRFFRDGATFSVLPDHRMYRPVVSASLALDYHFGGGLKPLWFHISTFFWFLVQLGLIFVLFRSTFERTKPGAQNEWLAIFGVALYGVHPVAAETVNYVIQRGDLYATLGVVAGLAIYAAVPRLRWAGLYLIPVVVGVLSKPPAAVFPALLFLWIWLFDEADFKSAVMRTLPAAVVTGAAAWWTVFMTPPTYSGGASSAAAYLLSQPAVLFGYFRKFFIPVGLSADTDRVVFQNLFQEEPIYGFLFVLLLLAGAYWCCRRRELRPIGFGLAWFFISSLPTSLIPLAEVENDHRMFMPFVGMALGVAWAALLLVERARIPARIAVPACSIIVALFAYGAHERNRVWATEESLWRDVTIKSPNNGRGLMNYGLTQMAKANYPTALDYFHRGLVLNPNYSVLEVNLGVANGAVGNSAEAEAHFLRAIQLAPTDATSHFYFARWLSEHGRGLEATAHLEAAVRQNPDYISARYLLMQLYADSGDAADLEREAHETLGRFSSDSTAASWLARLPSVRSIPPARPAQAPATAMTADAWLAQSLAYYQARKYPDCIRAAEEALKLKPDYAEAWNNIGAAWNQMAEWDRAAAAEAQALRLKPDLEIARNNLALAVAEKRKSAEKQKSGR